VLQESYKAGPRRLAVEEGQALTLSSVAHQMFHLYNSQGLCVSLLSYGATVMGVHLAPSRGTASAGDEAAPIPLTLGLENPRAYLQNVAHMGGVCGRYANRVAQARFTLNDVDYELTRNHGAHHLHGGERGFDLRPWHGERLRENHRVGVQFTYVSADGEEGYPGKLTAQVAYWLDDDNTLAIDYRAQSDRPTVINLTNHTYWNLSGEADIRGHEIRVDGDHTLEVDADLIPSGQRLPVSDSALDLREKQPLGEAINALHRESVHHGFDHCYVLPHADPSKPLRFAASLQDPATGRRISVYTDQPAMQLYTAGHLDGSAAVGGHQAFAGVCLECQNFPDSPNHEGFPSSRLLPGARYEQHTEYRFEW